MQLWPFYCHEQTTGPYRRHGDEKDAVECWTLQGAPTVVRLFPEVLDILNCLKQEVSETVRPCLGKMCRTSSTLCWFSFPSSSQIALCVQHPPSSSRTFMCFVRTRSAWLWRADLQLKWQPKESLGPLACYRCSIAWRYIVGARLRTSRCVYDPRLRASTCAPSVAAGMSAILLPDRGQEPQSAPHDH